MAEEETIIVTLVDEDGNEFPYIVAETYEIEGKEYALLVPEATEDEVTEVLIYRIETDENGDDILVDIADEDEWNKVSSAIEEFESERE